MYRLYTLPNKKVSTTKDHGKNYTKDRPLLVLHLLRNRLLYMSIYFEKVKKKANYA